MNYAIVTGADGFIGSHFLKFLNDINIPVIALVMKDSKNIRSISSLKNTTIMEFDLKDYRERNFPLPSNSGAAFYHLAWSGVSPESRSSVEKQLINLELSLNALKLAKQVHAERFITLGSTMEYLYAGKSINDKALPTPQNAYGATKLAVRYICQEFAKQEGIPFIYAVATGVYGIGRLDNNVITYTALKLLHKERPSLTRLEQLWDYIHINDLVEALYLIGEKGHPGAFYAIGHGDNCPLSQYIQVIHNLIDPKLPLGIGDIPYTTQQLPSSCVDLTSLQCDTGFKPKVSFEKGAKELIDYLKMEMI